MATRVNLSVYDANPTEKARGGARSVLLHTVDSAILAMEVGMRDGKGVIVHLTKAEASILADNIKTLCKDLRV